MDTATALICAAMLMGHSDPIPERFDEFVHYRLRAPTRAESLRTQPAHRTSRGQTEYDVRGTERHLIVTFSPSDHEAALHESCHVIQALEGRPFWKGPEEAQCYAIGRRWKECQ